MIRHACSLLAILAVFIAVGCTRKNPYDVMDRQSQYGERPVKAAVPNFVESRETGKTSPSTVSGLPIIGLWGGYMHNRHDEIYAGQVTPFPQLLAEGLTERTQEAQVFDEVEYVADKTPEPGAFDVIVKGDLKRVQAKGALYKYGFWKFSDLLWYIGLPKASRRWIVEVDYQLIDGYTGEPLTDVKTVSYSSRHKVFWQYYDRSKVTDLKNDLDEAYDGFIDWVWTETPEAEAEYWANLKEEGKAYLAAREREEELMKKGSPPTFQFLAPTSGATIRDAETDVRWSLTAPGGLKTVAMTINNQMVELGIDPLSLMNEGDAPRSVPASEVTVPLNLGENTLRARVIDHRGNETSADMSITRLPATLRPEKRYALLIAAGDSSQQDAVDSLAEVLKDPVIGQFEDSDIYTMKSDSLSKSDLQSTLSDFGSKPLSGNLALIYLRAEGNWGDLTIGADNIPFDEVISMIEGSLATSEVVLLVDIDWDGSGDEEIIDRADNVPARWAFVISQSKGGPSGSTMFASAIEATLKGDGDDRRLTLQRFLDGILSYIDDQSGGSMTAETYGRPDQSITMAERE